MMPRAIALYGRMHLKVIAGMSKILLDSIDMAYVRVGPYYHQFIKTGFL